MTCSRIVPDLRSPDTINKEIELKEKQLAAALNIEPINCAQVIVTHSTVKLTPDIAPEFHYPFDYVYPTGNTDRACHSTPLKRMHFISDDLDDVPESISVNQLTEYENHCGDMTAKDGALQINSPIPTTARSELPQVELMPYYMQIPNLWNVEIERVAALRTISSDAESATELGDSSAPNSAGSSSSDWELVDNQ